VLKEFFAFDTFNFSKKGVQFELVPERLRGETAKFDILDKHDKVIVPKDKRITVKYIRDLEAAGVKKIAVPDDYLLGRVLARNVVDTETGEILGSANDEITETVLAKLKEAEAAIEEDGAEVITFGCSAMFWLRPFVEQRLREIGWEMPVLEGYSCSIALAKAMVDLGVDVSGLLLPSDRPRKWRRKKVF